MCGIAGFVLKGGQSLDTSRVFKCSETIANRGPDDEGFFLSSDRTFLGRRLGAPTSSNWGLIHRRLSIIDLSPTGWQPMVHEESGLVAVLNGEIYNYQELAVELGLDASKLKGSSDTEVAMHAWLRWGTDAVKKFRGMFVFIIVSQRDRRMWIARDGLGIKPLFLQQTDRGLFFGSSIPAVLTLSGYIPPLRLDSVLNYLEYKTTTCGEHSFFEGVTRLAAGSITELSLDDPLNLKVERYWTPTPTEADSKLSIDDAAHQLRALYEDSVRLHVRSDTPVTLSLSGGIDSSGLAGLVSTITPGAVKVAYTYQAEESALNEFSLAQKVADKWGFELRSVRMDRATFADQALDAIKSHSEPFQTTSMLAEYCVYEQCHKDGYKVMLNGQGPDEILGGYAWFRNLRLASLIQSRKFGQTMEEAKAFSHWEDTPRPLVSPWTGLAALPTRLGENLLHNVRKRNALRFVESEAGEKFLHSDAQKRISKWRAMHSTIANWAIPIGLQNQLISCDQNSMRWSVEARVPFVMPEIVDFCMKLPESSLVHPDGTTKFVHRKALADLIPDEIMNVRKKIGFEADEVALLKSSPGLIAKGTASLASLEGSGLKMSALTAQLNLWTEQAIPSDLTWKILNLGLWLEHILESVIR